MSDFLGRLVGRAIGSEPLLAPRLPSLFEPLQRAPIMPLSDDGATSPLQREAVPASTAALTVAPMRSPHAPGIAMTDASRAAPAAVAPMAGLTPAHVTASTSRTVVPPAPIAAPAPSSVVERSVASPAPPHPAEALVPLPVQPRRTRIAAKQPEAPAPPHSSNGALLPVSSRVFGAAHTADAPSRSIHAAAIRTLAAQAGTGSPSGEPVVRVSIGRLEVRAAPAAGVPPRRRDGPRPGSLDDYLRQRGGKVSP